MTATRIARVSGLTWQPARSATIRAKPAASCGSLRLTRGVDEAQTTRCRALVDERADPIDPVLPRRRGGGRERAREGEGGEASAHGVQRACSEFWFAPLERRSGESLGR